MLFIKNTLALLLSLSAVTADDGVSRSLVKDSATINLSELAQTPENSLALKEIYFDFISSHQIDDEGNFVSGVGVPDSGIVWNYFKNYISRNPIKKTKIVQRRCPKCLGNSKIFIDTMPNNPISISKKEEKCPSCPDSGRVQVEVAFTVVCPTSAVPALPEKPKILKQRQLVKSATEGDTFAQIEYAKQLEGGAIGVEKNVSLAKDFYTKAFVKGNGFGLDGLVRVIENSNELGRGDLQLLYALKLLQAKLLKASQSSEVSFVIYPDELGVLVPVGMNYIDAKIAEIVARSLYFNHRPRDIRPEHLTISGLPAVLKPLKSQLEKAPMETARSKVEYLLVSMALSARSDEFGDDRLELAKQAAVSLDPWAFGILGDVCERGLMGKKKPQSASIFFSISKLIKAEKIISGRMNALDSRYDHGVTSEMLGEFSSTKLAGRANVNYIDAVLKLENSPVK
jgi:hypothetical protein